MTAGAIWRRKETAIKLHQYVVFLASFFFLREHLWNLQEVSANQWLAWPITGSLAAGRMVTMTTPNICYTVITAQFFSPFFGISGSSRLERYEETECLSYTNETKTSRMSCHFDSIYKIGCFLLACFCWILFHSHFFLYGITNSLFSWFSLGIN